MVQLLYKLDDNISLILQSFIETPFDVRAMVLNNEVIATMKREVVKGDFRSNYSQGANISEYKISDVERDQTTTAKAKRAFNEVINKFPQTEFANDALIRIDIINDRSYK